MLSFHYNRTSYVFVDVDVGAENHNFKFPLILDKFTIMIVMENLKFMEEFALAINVQCIHSRLQTKVRMRNCARAKSAKTCFCSIESNLKVQSSGKKCV